MKKALLLGALAFFAINIATVQTVNAQEKEDVTKIEKEKKAVNSETPLTAPTTKSTATSKNATTAKKAATAPKTIETSPAKSSKDASNLKNGTEKAAKKGVLSAKKTTTKGSAVPNSLKPKKPTDPVKDTKSSNKTGVK